MGEIQLEQIGMRLCRQASSLNARTQTESPNADARVQILRLIEELNLALDQMEKAILERSAQNTQKKV